MQIAPVYHGSPKRKGRAPFGSPGNKAPIISDGAPLFVTGDLAYTKHFCQKWAHQPSPRDLKKTLDLHEQAAQEHLLAIFNRDPEILAKRGPWDEDVDGDISVSSYFLLESKDVTRNLKSLSYDSVHVPEDHSKR